MQEEAAQIMSIVTKALLTITTEGWVGCAGSRSESSSSIPSDSPSTSVTVSSMVACFAFIVSILHLEFKEAICSWYPLIFWASSWGNIFSSLMPMQPGEATGPAALELPRPSGAVPSRRSPRHGSAAALLTSRMSPARGPGGALRHRTAQGSRGSGCAGQGWMDGQTDRQTAHVRIPPEPEPTSVSCTLQQRGESLPLPALFPPAPHLLPFIRGWWSSPHSACQGNEVMGWPQLQKMPHSALSRKNESSKQ